MAIRTNLSVQNATDLSQIKKAVKFDLVLDSSRVYNNLYANSDKQLSLNWHNIDVSNIQSFNSHRLFKLFAANDSSFSASLLTYVRMLEDNYRVTAYKANKTPFDQAQKAIDALRERFDFIDNYQGFVLSNTIKDQINRMVRNILTTDNSAGALFIVLRNNFEPEEFKILDCDAIYFEDTQDKKRKVPFIYDANKKTYLDYSNFLWQPLDPDAREYVGNNPLRPALRTTFTKMEFLDNLRKVLKNQAWPKIKVVLDEQAVIKMAPDDVKMDMKKLIEFLNAYIDKMEEQLTGIDPDQNIIVYDTIKEISYLESSQRFDPTPISNLLDAELISSLKTPPSTVGKGGSTRTGEGLASAELVIFRRSIKAVRGLVEVLYSRAFTLCMRLLGFQGYAKFKLDEFNLRPEDELAQFHSIKQENIIGAWLIGAIGDEEKNKKLRHLHSLDGTAPADAKEREDPRVSKPDRQTERTAIAEGDKNTKTEQTRKNRKAGTKDK